MKIRNIAFSGFMASILMAGAAYAADIIPTNILATTSYVQGGVEHAISTSEGYTDAAIGSITTEVEGGVVKAANTVDANLQALDTKAKTNAANIATNTSNISANASAISDLEGLVGEDSVADQITDALTAAGIGEGVEDLGTRLAEAEDDIDALEEKVDTTGTVSSAITGAIADLDATRSQTAAAANGQLYLKVTEVDGVITGIEGSITENTYDAYGAASDVQGDTDQTVASVDAKITTLNGDAATTGSVAKSIKTAMTCGTETGDLCLVKNDGSLVKVTTEDTWGD